MADALALKAITEWTREDAKAAAGGGLPVTYPVARLMIEEHKYWQNGTLWPVQVGGQLGSENLKRIEPNFIPDPLLEECVDNRGDGVLQREATITFVAVKPAAKDSDEEKAQKARAQKVLDALVRWWDEKKFWRHVRIAFNRTSYSRRAALRIGVAPGNLTRPEPTLLQRVQGVRPAAQLPTGQTLDTALDLLEVTAPPPDTARVYIIPDTRRKAAVIMETVIVDGREEERAEIWSTSGLGAAKKTSVKQIGANGSAEFPVDLKGRLPLAQMETDELITDPVIKNQALLNFANTILSRVMETAGFPQTFLGNVEPPGLWLPYEPSDAPALASEVVKGVRMWKHRIPWQFGFSSVSELIGLREVTRTGLPPNVVETESFMEPSVVTKEPTDPTYVVTGKTEIRSTIYGVMKQKHLANTATAEASGIAYQQARAIFEAYLSAIKGEAEGMVRDILEAALAYAGLMTDELGDFLTQYRCSVTLHVQGGPVTADDVTTVIAARDGRLISQTTAQSRVNVEDPTAEQALIMADPFVQQEFSKKQAETVGAWITEGQAERAQAAQLARMTPEDQKILEASAVPEPPTAPGGTGEGGTKKTAQGADNEPRAPAVAA